MRWINSFQLMVAASVVLAGCSKGQDTATPALESPPRPLTQEEVWQGISSKCSAHFKQPAQVIMAQSAARDGANHFVKPAKAQVQSEVGADTALKTITQLLGNESFIGQLEDGRCCEVRLQQSYEADRSVHEVRVQMEVQGSKGGASRSLSFWVNRDPGPKVFTLVSPERVQVMRAIQSVDPEPDERAEAANYLSVRLDDRGPASIAIYDVGRIETDMATATCERRPLP